MICPLLWTSRTDARIRFDLGPDTRAGGTSLRWALTVEEPEPEPALVGHFRKQMNELITGGLRTRSDSGTAVGD